MRPHNVFLYDFPSTIFLSSSVNPYSSYTSALFASRRFLAGLVDLVVGQGCRASRWLALSRTTSSTYMPSTIFLSSSVNPYNSYT
ncbi:MAG: hypothetical protein ACRDGA_11490, partial [Bacteroidota bacterium]